MSAGSDVLSGLGARHFASRQLLVVRNVEASRARAIIYPASKGNTGWVLDFPPIAAVIGKAGFAALGEKLEGDGKTPSGFYFLGTAFGVRPALDCRLPYRQALEDDVWVDDPRAPDYNTWTKEGRTSAASFERMRRADGLYDRGIVVEYNTRPVAKGKGSAIFLHLWRDADSPTEGCVAIAEADLLRLLAWLDPAQQPAVLLGDD